MFVKVKVLDMDGRDTVMSINMLNISHLSLKNAKNADEGTLVHLRSGEYYVSTTSMDLLSLELSRQCENIMTIMYMAYMVESKSIVMSRMPKPKRSRAKGTSSKTSTK